MADAQGEELSKTHTRDIQTWHQSA